MVKRLFPVLFLLFAGVAHAGYYAKILTANGSYWRPVGTTSTCYLTVAMAIGSLAPSVTGSMTVTSIDMSANTWAAWYLASGYVGSGTVGTCDAVPQGGTMPAVVGGVDDPGLVAGGVAVGGSSGACMEVITNAADAELIAGGFLLLLAIAFGFRQIRASLDSQHLSDEKH